MKNSQFKNTRRYLERDPFNPQNEIECEVSLDKGYKYGALIIHKINGEKLREPQIIYGTPKLRYPFDQNGNWHFPSAIRILSYRKYDGTNIFMYQYEHKGNTFTTYKVRLFPFLRGRILTLWKACLDMYPDIKRLMVTLPEMTGFAFEMYGNVHTHLIEYDHELDIKLLFALKGTDIVPVNDVDNKLNLVSPVIMNVPFAKMLDFYAKDYIFHYQYEQQRFEDGLTETENGFRGQEGSVWYLQDKKENWHLFKCKPNSIEKIHWASYPLDINIIRATATNVLEVYDSVDYTSLCELLLEEYPKQQIEISSKRIQKVIDEFDIKTQFKERVRLAITGLPRDLSITDTLRQLSKIFEKQEMSAVYKALVDLTSGDRN